MFLKVMPTGTLAVYLSLLAKIEKVNLREIGPSGEYTAGIEQTSTIPHRLYVEATDTKLRFAEVWVGDTDDSIHRFLGVNVRSPGAQWKDKLYLNMGDPAQTNQVIDQVADKIARILTN